ncbi:MAG: V-type ATP synthase subunit K [Methanosphaera sp.]|uniref:V-type ATP synthase subunit K n=1 Tax=Methanosphaera sp. TaxID=2666342 RepID=UPI0025F52C45|nr:V-type ATP synthase subunit K [Methanosphaera sp.]MCI5867232.1 V-type ATP synthase subunit K [Methanosphaera sp.]MDD6534700.1 V-type ATP synthase subunit K [Methanosphaera sp.]MDY3955632.1 V-type ATP synthase subunit K [Methanosphaera sp.]
MAAELALGSALAAIGAGAAVGFAALGSGIGQGIASSASVGAVAEDSGMFAQGLVFTAIPETQAIYGFLIAILLLVFSGIMGGSPLGVASGLVAIGAGVAVGFGGLGSGMGQGIASSASVGAVVEEPDMFAQGLVFTAIPETQAIYGFLIAILLLVFGGILGA